MTDDWQPVVQQLAELRRKIGRAQEIVDSSFVKLAAIQRSVRLRLSVAAALAATGSVLLFCEGVLFYVWWSRP